MGENVDQISPPSNLKFFTDIKELQFDYKPADHLDNGFPMKESTDKECSQTHKPKTKL